MDNKDNKKFHFGRILIGVLAVLGVLFILILLIPDSDHREDRAAADNRAPAEETVSEVTEEEGEAKGEEKNEDRKEEEKEKPEPPRNVEPAPIGTDAKNATIMVYMNGSDLESEAGEATADISEMLDSGVGDNVNVIIQTMGTKKWQDYGISSKTSQIYKVKGGKLQLLEDDLGQLDCTASETLADFISYGRKNFPADRYIFIFWDHGGGPVYGFGYDEWQGGESSLTLDEIASAFQKNSDIHFDIIGMDCCIMANVETCYVLSPFCRYSVLSEDFESSLGWYYKDWMKSFEDDPGMSTPLLGKKIIDGMISANEEDGENGMSSTMVLVNERAVPDLTKKWIDFAYKNSDELLGVNYSRLHKAKGKGFFADLIGSWADDISNVTMADFYVSDMMSIIESVKNGGDSDDELKASLKACVAYFGHTSDENELTGLAVSLPYGDREYYDRLSRVYSKCGFDDDYIKWLENFVNAEGQGNYHDYSFFEQNWGGWGSYGSSLNTPICSSGNCDDSYTADGSSCDTYDSSCDTYDPYYDTADGELPDDWVYDYDEEIWYMYEDGILYLYDDETELMCYYDEEDDLTYYYDEEDEEWYLLE